MNGLNGSLNGNGSLCLAQIIGDKSITDDDFRNMFLEHSIIDGHQHEGKIVVVDPSGISREIVAGRTICSVPVHHLNSSPEKKFPLPLFMLKFNEEGKEQVIESGAKKGITIKEKHFQKLRIPLASEEIAESNDSFSDDDDFMFIPGLAPEKEFSRPRKLIKIGEHLKVS